jgi:quercetin dioxygenase-like cupin family protein
MEPKMTEKPDVSKFLFNLADKSQGLLRNMTEGVEARVFYGQQVMLSVVELQPNTSGKPHSHPEEQWGVCLEGDAVRMQGGIEFPVKAGDFWYTPGNVEHTMRAGPRGMKLIDIFAPLREEYKTAGEGFGPGVKT